MAEKPTIHELEAILNAPESGVIEVAPNGEVTVRERPYDWPLPSFDAQDWAQEFCRIAKTMGHDLDEGWVLGWFANALMRGYDEKATHGFSCTDDNAPGLSIFLRSRRGTLGLSLSELAERVGCSKAHVWDLETGRATNPTLDTICALSAALGVSAIQLVRAALQTAE